LRDGNAMTLDYSPRHTDPSSSDNSLLWAVFLACSWTWCIGMWLPVLLVRDYGVWGWIVFAAPNVMGAAAMGWALRDADASRRLASAHPAACCWFSVVTLAFHVFWVIWLSRLFDGLWAAALVSAAAFYLAGGVRSHADLWTGVVALGISIGCFVAQLSRQRVFLASERWDWVPASDLALPLFALAAVCCLGFALCPYLDLTFHRARQATSPVGGRVAFSLRFGVFFLLMIGFTLMYSKDLLISRFLPRVSVTPKPAACPRFTSSPSTWRRRRDTRSRCTRAPCGRSGAVAARIPPTR
jgi:hypothetical protein